MTPWLSTGGSGVDYEDLIDSLRCEEVADDLGVIVTSIAGDEHWAHCPYPSHHGLDRNPSFSFNVEKCVASCFSCGGGGDFAHLVSQVMGISREAAIEWLAPYSDISSDIDEVFLKQVDRALQTPDRNFRLPSDPLPWYPTKRVDDWCQRGLDERMEWFEGRGITEEVVRDLRLGFDPEHGPRRDYVGPAIIIPHFVNGTCTGWQERWERHEGTPADLGKYTNSPGMPRDHLYGFKPCDTMIVVEAPLTKARIQSVGLDATATFGAKVDPRHVKDLRRCREVWLALDNDEAGDQALELLIAGLEEYVELYVVPPPAGLKEDLGDVDDDTLAELLDARVSAFELTLFDETA